MNPLSFPRTAGCLLLLSPAAFAGPYAPAAGQPGSAALHYRNAAFTAWANHVSHYQPGANTLPAWQNTALALGRASEDPTHVVSLGDGGTITLTFPGFIKDGPGPDFAVFENAVTDTFLEFAWVEVSRDGVNFVRFPNRSLTPGPVGSFSPVDPTNVDGLAGKYRQPYGTPFDLADVGLDLVSHVRLVDIPGDGSAKDSAGEPIYDPFPNAQSAGFDLDAVGVIHLQAWQTMEIATLEPDRVNALALAHLPDGRFVLGLRERLSAQETWGLPARRNIASGGVEFDPSFLAVRDETLALLGAGGSFGGLSGLHAFNPSAPDTPPRSVPLATLQNFSGVFWKSPASGREGWLIGGSNGPSGGHSITYVATGGEAAGPLTEELCAYSAGLAVDAEGNLFAALYELEGSPRAEEAGLVLRFPAAKVDAAVEAILNGNGAPLAKADGARVFRFDDGSALAVDAAGRVWSGGFKTSHLQVYDPATGASRRVTPEHAPFPAGADVIYQPSTFTREGRGYVAFAASDELGAPGAPVYYGVAPLSAISIPNTLRQWQAFRFGAEALTPETEATLWGAAADPDGDGLSNLLEYALALDPLTPEASPVVPEQRNGALALTFTRDPLRTDLTYTVEAAADPAGEWTPLASSVAGNPAEAVEGQTPVVMETEENGLTRVTVQDGARVTASARRFLRLRVSLSP